MTNIDQRPPSSGAEPLASSGAAAPPPAAAPRAKQRSPLRTVALPSEHGGWGLTLEPVLLGLLVAHSVSALCIGLAAVLAFLARTPLKLAVVDARRGRTLERTRMARKVAAAELAVLAVLVVVAFLTATPGFWWPIFGIAPLLLVELSYGIPSRSRRLVPRLLRAASSRATAAFAVSRSVAADLQQSLSRLRIVTVANFVDVAEIVGAPFRSALVMATGGGSDGNCAPGFRSPLRMRARIESLTRSRGEDCRN